MLHGISFRGLRSPPLHLSASPTQRKSLFSSKALAGEVGMCKGWQEGQVLKAGAVGPQGKTETFPNIQYNAWHIIGA